MMPHSDQFKKALLSPIKELHVRIELYTHDMQYIESIEKKVSQGDVGSISVDKNRPIRRNFSFSLVNKNGEFTWNEYGKIWLDKRVKVYTGLRLRDRTIEYIPQGVFILTEPTTNSSPQGSITTLNGQDKAYLYNDKRGKFTSDTIIAEGINVATAIKTIAQDETMFLFDEITEVTPYELTYSSNENRWKAMEDLAKFAKAEIFYDVNGYLRLKKVSDLNSLQNESIVWSFSKGDMFYAGNVRKMDESQLYNDFVALGGGSNTSAVSHRLTVTESNPLWMDSPYSIEKIGRMTYFHNEGNADSLLVTEEDCIHRNKYELMRKLGYAEKVACNIAPLFVLDVSDIIQIEDSENGVTGRYMVEKFDIPLTPQIVTMECAKEIRVISDWSLL